jgi:signal transduction histidine kinase
MRSATIAVSDDDPSIRKSPRQLLHTANGDAGQRGSFMKPSSEPVRQGAGVTEVGSRATIEVARLRARGDATPPTAPPDAPTAGSSTAIRLLLAASEATAIGFGPALLAVYNAAFAGIIGADSISAAPAVRPLHDLCAALWPRLEPLVEDAVHHGKSAVLDEQLFCSYRDGYAEEMYLRCSCSPLVDDLGGVGGVVVTLAETTERMLSVRRTAALRDVAAAASATHSVAEACRRALDAVARHPNDIPFALLYLRDSAGQQVLLASTAGLGPGVAEAPASIALDAADGTPSWPVAAALKDNATVIVDDILARFGTLPAGYWPFAPKTALVVPLTSPGRDEPDGALVAGVSARHELNAQYREFIELVVKQIAAGIAGGRVHEDKVRRATARAAAQLARAKRRARIRAMKARFTGVIEERTRLAREIHDTFLQGVTGIALQLRAVLPHVRTAPDAAAEALERIVELAERTSRDARAAVWDMRPSTPAEDDLARASEAAARGLTEGTCVAVRVLMTGSTRPLSPKRQAAALRVVKEAVANVVRHAQARTVNLRFVYGEWGVSVAVIDDGKGFAVAEDFRSYVGHWGLVGMQERAQTLGGTLLVRSSPGRGSTVTLLMPYGTRRSARARTPRDGSVSSALRSPEAVDGANEVQLPTPERPDGPIARRYAPSSFDS